MKAYECDSWCDECQITCEERMENFNESVKGNTSVSNPYDDSNWDGE